MNFLFYDYTAQVLILTLSSHNVALVRQLEKTPLIIEGTFFLAKGSTFPVQKGWDSIFHTFLNNVSVLIGEHKVVVVIRKWAPLLWPF